MNIMDLPIGAVCVAPGGTRYRVLRDEQERRPGLGVVRVRVTEDQVGNIAKFIRGVEVELDHR